MPKRSYPSSSRPGKCIAGCLDAGTAGLRPRQAAPKAWGAWLIAASPPAAGLAAGGGGEGRPNAFARNRTDCCGGVCRGRRGGVVDDIGLVAGLLGQLHAPLEQLAQPSA